MKDLEPGAPHELGRRARTTLPPDVLSDASRRLGRAGLLYALTFFVAYFVTHAISAMVGDVAPGDLLERPVQTATAVVSILAGLGVFAFARRAGGAPERVLAAGLAFWVLGAVGISVAETWNSSLVRSPGTPGTFVGLSWVCMWLLLFPVIAPSSPRRILGVGLVVASIPPLVLWAGTRAGATQWEGFSLPAYAVHFGFTTYLSAAIAYVLARIVYRFGRQLSEAREVGSYRLLEPLGEGGMGEVWRARHRLLAKPAAVKLIRPEVFAPAGRDGGARRRFEREAAATSLLRSVHTIELYDFGVAEDGRFFYVMELLDGFSLDRLVREHGPQPAGRVIHILRQACRSLEEAHGAGLIHRDIKPANIFLCRFGVDVDFVKVLDFGLVKARPDMDLGAHDETLEGAIAGTPAYMPPEVIGQKAVDPRADLYQLGCVGYWLLTGKPVFSSTNAVGLLVDHAREAPRPPSERTDRPIPSDLERVILRCLEKEPAARYQTAAELDLALARCASATAWLRSDALSWWRRCAPEVTPLRSA